MYSIQQPSLVEFGYHPSLSGPDDSPISNSSIEINVPRSFARDVDFMAEVLDEDIFRDMEQALQEQRVCSREYHQISSIALPHHATSYAFSDTDSSSSTEVPDPHFSDWLCSLDDNSQTVRRLKRAHEGELLEPSLIQFASVVQPNERRAMAPKEPKKRKRSTRTTTKRTRALFASAGGSLLSGDDTASGSSSTSTDTKATPMTGASTRAEFERMVSSLSTPLLLCVVTELAGVREGKERVYCSSASRAPDHALRDPNDGRPFIYRKVIPHQHKPEKSGDPSPRCFACAARMMHERAMALSKQRPDSSSEIESKSSDNIEAARRVIITALGLPAKTRVFEYETVAEPAATGSTKL